MNSNSNELEFDQSKLKFKFIINYSMSINLAYFKSLKIYSHLKVSSLLNHIFCNRIMHSKLLVSAAPSIYNILKFIPGKTITNWLISSTFNKVLTGGSSLTDVVSSSLHLYKKNIPVIIDFCAENGQEGESGEAVLDYNTQQYVSSSNLAVQNQNYMISIKISALVNASLLKKYNRSAILIKQIWEKYQENGQITAEKLLQAFQNIYAGTTEEDVLVYAKEIHNYFGSDLRDFTIDEIAFKMNHQPYYLFDDNKNQLLISKLILPLDNQQKKYIQSLKQRLNLIFQPHFKNDNNFRILVDAQQSYYQSAIQSINQQLQKKYNRERAYVIPTLQTYLNNTEQQVIFELEAAKRLSNYFALKLVKGNYLLQERKLALQNEEISPIVQSFQKTNQNFINNFIRIIKTDIRGQIFAAVHNPTMIKTLIEVKEAYSPKVVINFAQLYGQADHLTCGLKDKKQKVYKLLPWAQTQKMVPFMLGRAQQLAHLPFPLDTQYTLLKHQLLFRTLSI